MSESTQEAPPAPLGPVAVTGRGFQIVEFKDRYGLDCSIQQSSIATEACLWLGVTDAKPEIMATDAPKHGVFTQETTGWVPFPVPQEVLLHTRMHLSREQVRSLIPVLQRWLEDEKFGDDPPES